MSSPSPQGFERERDGDDAPPPQIHRRLALESEFRLAVLLPSPDVDSQLECRLEHAVLGACKPYEALSYVWKSSRFTKEIILDGQEFRITSSLECALRSLRLPEEERTLWIDAICINQRDLAERQQQVEYMRQIYSNCSSDVFWLGPKDKALIRGMEIIRKLKGFNLEQIESLGWESVERRTTLGRNVPLELKENSQIGRGVISGSPPDESSRLEHRRWFLSDSDTDAIRSLLSFNPIWRRVWIMQEISCSPKVILTCGNESLDWSLVEGLLEGVNYYTDAFHAPFKHGKPKSWTKLFGTAKFITTQREAMSNIQQGGESTLLDVLVRFEDTESTDPRDKVYGLLGLVSDTLGVQADYRKSVQETYAGVALALINASANLDLICQCTWGLPRVGRHLVGLPYWAPDFRLPRKGEFLFAQRNIYLPGRPTCSVPCVVEGPGIIHLNGFLLGRLKASIGVEFYSSKVRNLIWVDMWQAIIRDWSRENGMTHTTSNNTRPKYHTGEDQLQAFWRTLVGDCKGYPTERLTPEDIAHDQNIVQEVVTQEATTERIIHMRSFKILDKLLRLWRFYTTDNGLFVLAQPEASEGDVVVVLNGAKTPMVLRSTTEDSGGNVLYLPCSGAYVHGFMDEEVLKREDEFKEQVFRVI